MLLRSETKLKYSVDLTLVFDDGTQKYVELCPSPENEQYALIEFVRDGNRFRRAGKILMVYPALKKEDDPWYVTHDTYIQFDCGTAFESCRLRISTSDIRNIRLVDREYILNLISETEYEITDDMFDEPEEEIPDETDTNDDTTPDENTGEDTDLKDTADGDADTSKDTTPEETTPEEKEESSEDSEKTTEAGEEDTNAANPSEDKNEEVGEEDGDRSEED